MIPSHLRFSFALLATFPLLVYSQHTDPLRILDEEVRMSFSGLKIDFTHITYEKEVTYEIMSPEGVELLEYLLLPEPIDRLYRDNVPEHWNTEHYVDEIAIEDFKVEVKSGFGRWVERRVRVSYRWVETMSFWSNRYGRVLHTVYRLPRLQTGDVVRLTYRWNAPFRKNIHLFGSFRIFHHGPWHKDKTKFILQHPEEFLINLHYVNGDTPHDIRKGRNNTVLEVWKYSDLKGALDEVGTHAYEELPFIEVAPHQANLLKHFFRGKYSFVSEATSISIGSTSKEYMNLRRYASDSGLHQRSGWQRFVSMHNDIALNFDYINDTEVYAGKKRDKRTFGTDLLENKLRDHQRYTTYAALLHFNELPFMLGYISDNRQAAVSENFMRPAFTSDYLLLVADSNDLLHFVYPKFQRTGLFMNELPFFYENTEVNIVPPHTSHLSAKTANDLGTYTSIRSLKSSADENIRNCHSVVEVRFSEGRARFKTRLSLLGQFSTLMRGHYAHNETFNNINPRYNTRVWEFDASTELLALEDTVISTVFPFTTKIECEYEQILQTPKEETTALPIGKWLLHVYETRFDSAGRTLAYYPDFPHQDKFVFRINLEKPVKHIELPPLVYANNDYGFYYLQTEVEEQQTITVTSTHAVKADKVPPENLGDVAEINNAIQEAEAAVIRIQH